MRKSRSIRSLAGLAALALGAPLAAQITVEGYGQGCPGAASIVPSIGFRGQLGLGATTEWIVVRGRANSVAVLVFGLRPFRLPVGGACTLLTIPIVKTPVATDGSGFAGVRVLLPNDARLKNVGFRYQYFVADPAGGAFGIGSMSNGVLYTIR